MSDQAGNWSFWSVAIGGGIIGGIIGALMESYSAFLLEGVRERSRARNELINLARNWGREGKPDRFRHAKLKRSDLRGAQLDGSDWSYADLRGANLTRACLSKATLYQTDLRGADLAQADLTHAHLDEAVFDQHARLPDFVFWSQGTDLARFTDPDHPRYTRSDTPVSSA